MDQENKFEPKENNVEENVTRIEESAHEHHSHHGSSSHHSSHSHSSTHSHHGGHHSSSRRHKRRSRGSRKNDDKSLLDKTQAWIDKKLTRKGIIVLSLWVLIIIILLIGVIYLAETVFSDNEFKGDYQNDFVSDSTGTVSENQSYVSSGVTYTVPSYWNKMIEEKTKTVKSLQTAGGKDCVSFVWASDTHIPDNSTARTNDLGKVMAKMMDNCDIPFAVLTGDIGTRSSFDTEAELVRTQEMIPVHLSPLWGTERLLVALGNHDGCYGDSSCYYSKQFAPERMWEFYFRNQSLDTRRLFSDDGSYYYIDNVAQKTRFIILNSQYGGEYSVDGNGVAVNNRFSTSCYGQEQLDWLADVALDMPEGYGAVITAHVPPNVAYTADKIQLIGIINAYCKKTTYSGSYTAGVDGWTNSSVDVDFSNAKGEIIAMFAGHVHQDTIDTTTLACPLITIISAGADVNAGESPERTFGTDTETSFDVVTINRKTRTIYCTRVGAGEDRVIKY